VLVERFAAETKTKAGIMLPEKALGKVLDARVVAVGPGARNDVSFFSEIPSSREYETDFFSKGNPSLPA
jgi:co-chaperonin GroES (HSP10)